ncbi:vitellogenin-like isoform X1 [Montipora foliosa]|uniref:vitellogenin-like isoform X1 n=2 Tax=Montipora foliosa TaxID=591990 RepID=UPI0035F10D3B
MKTFLVLLLSLGAVSAMHLGYEVGKRYTHSYQCDVTNAMPGGATKTLGLQVKCNVHVDVINKTEIQVTLRNIQVHQVQGIRENPAQKKENANPKVFEAMQKNLEFPVQFLLKSSDGSIKKIRVHPRDSEWSLNVKRGLINLFQITGSLDQKYFIQQESTAVGDCQVAYAIRRRKHQPAEKQEVLEVTKAINYDKCRYRPEFKQSNYLGEVCQECRQCVGYSPYHRAVGQIEHTLTGSPDTGYVIDRAEAYEDHVITPFAQAAGQVTAKARQILQFESKADAGEASTELTKTVRLTFTAQNPEAFAKDKKQQQQLNDQAKPSIQEMFQAAKDSIGQNAGQKFAAAVYALRRCNKLTLRGLMDEMAKHQDQTERKLFLDAFSFVGTCGAFQVIKEKAQVFKASDLNRLFLGLAATPRPDACHIKAARDLCNDGSVSGDRSCRHHCLLSFGALLNKIKRRRNFKQYPNDVKEYENSLKDMKNQLNADKTAQDDKLMYIQALGNAGSSEVQDDLQNILENKQQPLRIRVEIVWALRRIARQTSGKAKAYRCFMAIFADPGESAELRMAIFVQILNTGPNFATLQAIANIVKREIANPQTGPRSNQLASFVFSHLSALAYSSSILTKKRSVQARLVLRLMPEMKYGPTYSKGVRLAFSSGKYQSGIEIEANKLDLPDSVLPRNLNARLQLNVLGYRLKALEFGARIQNMDDVVDYVMSKIYKRSKRSIWGTFASMFDDEKVDDTDDYSTQGSGEKSNETPAMPISNDKQSRERHLSVFMKIFGNEMHFMELRQENVDQMAQDLSDLLFGQKTRLEYPNQGIAITKNGVEIKQTLQKSFLGAHARHTIPTLAGIALDMELRSATTARVTAVANMQVTSSWLTFWQFSKMTGTVEIKPRVNTHAHALVGIHTPLLRVGVQIKANIRSNSDQKADVEAVKGKKCTVKYNIPQGQQDLVHFKVNTEGFTQQWHPDTSKITEKQISMELNRDHITQLQQHCAGQDMLGVQYCVEGKFPDLSALRLQQVQVLPAFAQVEGRFSMAPAVDKPTLIEWTHQRPLIPGKDQQVVQILGEINVLGSTKAVTRKIPYKITYKRGNQRELAIECNALKVKGYEDAMMTVRFDSSGLKLAFGTRAPGQKEPQYEINVSGQTETHGKCFHAQAQWKKLPEQWKNFFYQWEPQIWNVLQQFAWVRRIDQHRKQVELQIQLKTEATADISLKTPNAVVGRTNMLLPLRVERFPSSYEDIMNNVYARCEVQDRDIRVFDELRYTADLKSGCPYVLVRDHNRAKISKITLTVQINGKGQKTLRAVIGNSKETVEIKPDDDHPTILIDGQKCTKQECKTKLQDATVHKIEMSGGKSQIQLSTKLGLYATIDGQQIRLYASPLLHGHVRGLCGDANGEQWNEFRDPKDQVQDRQNFVKSWQQKC